ncbi:MAG: SGNH/GDSL hydrolase family protein [Desulfomonile tiedjei]|uniref:SGNH/GDSL hydrolase family protein n=1 Tax=Desulfomonile tiedjei TaxID=2358 RepID=A0A9D6V252_9BACT|nr:SGNH/GDSL hydrolase family protein [Desulfomonile tiedjei]
MAVLAVEVLSFLAITVTNYIFYGHAREGSRAVYDAYTLFLQEHGIRPTAFNAQSDDPDKNKYIWIFGGSTMRGSTDFSDRTIPSCISMLLNSNRDGINFTIINFGTNSFNSLLETKYLQKKLIDIQPPDVIVFYDGANDVKYFLEHRDPYAHHGYRRAKALIESYYKSWFGLLKPLNAAVYASFTKELYDKVMQVGVAVDTDTPEFRQLVDATEKRYDHVNKLAGSYGARFVLFWQPTLWTEDCQVAGSAKAGEKSIILDDERWLTVRNNFTKPYVALQQRLEKKDYFVDFRDVLCSRQVPAYKPDGVHLTDEGRLLIAESIASVLKEKLDLDLPDSITEQ